MGKQTTIIMLPTKDASPVWVTHKGNIVGANPNRPINPKLGKNKHLYEVSDEPIKAGDLCYLGMSEVVERAIHDSKSGVFQAYKVIGATDRNFDDVPELSKEKVSTYIKQH